MDKPRVPASVAAIGAAADALDLQPPSVFTQLRRLACKLDREVKDAQSALQRQDGDAVSSGRLAAYGSRPHAIATGGMSLLRQKQQEALMLQQSMTEFLGKLRAANDTMEATLVDCESTLKARTATMDRIEGYLKLYGYQPYSETVSSNGSLPGSPVSRSRPLEAGETCSSNLRTAPDQLLHSACKTPPHAGYRSVLSTAMASNRKENIMRTPKLMDFVSKETLNLIRSVSKEDKSQKFVPRSLPFESMNSELVHTVPSDRCPPICSDIKGAASVNERVNASLRHTMQSVASTRSGAASPDDFSEAIRPLVTPKRPPCVQQLFVTPSFAAASINNVPPIMAASLQCPAKLETVQATVETGSAIPLSTSDVPAIETDHSCCMAPMDDVEYGRLEHYLRRCLSQEDINMAIRKLSEYFSEPLNDRSKGCAEAILEACLGRKGKSVLLLLIMTRRLESQGTSFVPMPAAVWSSSNTSSTALR